MKINERTQSAPAMLCTHQCTPNSKRATEKDWEKAVVMNNEETGTRGGAGVELSVCCPRNPCRGDRRMMYPLTACQGLPTTSHHRPRDAVHHARRCAGRNHSSLGHPAGHTRHWRDIRHSDETGSHYHCAADHAHAHSYIFRNHRHNQRSHHVDQSRRIDLQTSVRLVS